MYTAILASIPHEELGTRRALTVCESRMGRWVGLVVLSGQNTVERHVVDRDVHNVHKMGTKMIVAVRLTKMISKCE